MSKYSDRVRVAQEKRDKAYFLEDKRHGRVCDEIEGEYDDEKRKAAMEDEEGEKP